MFVQDLPNRDVAEWVADLQGRGVLAEGSDLGELMVYNARALLMGVEWMAEELPGMFEGTPVKVGVSHFERDGQWTVLMQYDGKEHAFNLADDRYATEEGYTNESIWSGGAAGALLDDACFNTIHELAHHAQGQFTNEGWEHLFALQRLATGNQYASFPDVDPTTKTKVMIQLGQYTGKNGVEMGAEAERIYAAGIPGRVSKEMRALVMASHQGLVDVFGPNATHKHLRRPPEQAKARTPFVAISDEVKALRPTAYRSGVDWSADMKQIVYARTASNLYRIARDGVIDVNESVRLGRVTVLEPHRCVGVSAKLGFPLQHFKAEDLVGRDGMVGPERHARPSSWDTGQVLELVSVQSNFSEEYADHLLEETESRTSELVREVETQLFALHSRTSDVRIDDQRSTAERPARSSITWEQARQQHPYFEGLEFETDKGRFTIDKWGGLASRDFYAGPFQVDPQVLERFRFSRGKSAELVSKDGNRRASLGTLKSVSISERLPLSKAALDNLISDQPVASVAAEVQQRFTEIADRMRQTERDIAAAAVTAAAPAATQTGQVFAADNILAFRQAGGDTIRVDPTYEVVYVSTTDGRQLRCSSDGLVHVGASVTTGEIVRRDPSETEVEPKEIVTLSQRPQLVTPFAAVSTEQPGATELVQEVESALLMSARATGMVDCDQFQGHTRTELPATKTTMSELTKAPFFVSVVLDTDQGRFAISRTGSVLRDETHAVATIDKGDLELVVLDPAVGLTIDSPYDGSDPIQVKRIDRIWLVEEPPLSRVAFRALAAGAQPPTVAQQTTERLSQAAAEFEAAARAITPPVVQHSYPTAAVLDPGSSMAMSAGGSGGIGL